MPAEADVAVHGRSGEKANRKVSTGEHGGRDSKAIGRWRAGVTAHRGAAPTAVNLDEGFREAEVAKALGTAAAKRMRGEETSVEIRVGRSEFEEGGHIAAQQEVAGVENEDGSRR